MPYVAFSALALLWHAFWSGLFHCTYISDRYHGWSIVSRDLFCMLGGIGIGTLWFLPVLFMTYVNLVLIGSRIKHMPPWGQMTILFALFLVLETAGMAVSNTTFVPASKAAAVLFAKYQNTIYRILYGSAFTIWGYLLYGCLPMLHTASQKAGAAAMCIGMAIFGWKIRKLVFFDWGLCSLFFGSLCLYYPESERSKTKIEQLVLYCGQNSLAIMIYHYIFLLPVEQSLLSQIGIYEGGLPALGEWILFAVNLGTTVALTAWCSRFEIGRFLLGQGQLFRHFYQTVCRLESKRNELTKKVGVWQSVKVMGKTIVHQLCRIKKNKEE